MASYSGRFISNLEKDNNFTTFYVLNQIGYNKVKKQLLKVPNNKLFFAVNKKINEYNQIFIGAQTISRIYNWDGYKGWISK